MWPFSGSRRPAPPPPEGLRETRLDFILMLVAEGACRSKRLGEILEFIQQGGGMIESMTGTLVTVYFGVPVVTGDPETLRLALVSALGKRFPGEIAAVHGACVCPVGLIGHPSRMSFTALLPDHRGKLARLAALEPGDLVEV